MATFTGATLAGATFAGRLSYPIWFAVRFALVVAFGASSANAQGRVPIVFVPGIGGPVL